MGLDVNGVRFLLYAGRLGVDFSETMMVGRQGLHLTAPTLRACLSDFGLPADPATVDRLLHEEDGFADALLRHLGAAHVTSLDVSGYERATVVHDLNQPVPEDLEGRFSAVIDGGTLEHVFDFPAAIRNCMVMVRPGGHFLSITPTNNFMGHGFYQFSPELFFSVLSEANGFEVEHMLVFDVFREAWFEVRSPRQVKRRVGVVTDVPAYLLVLARRTRAVDVLRATPQQSDYAPVWEDPTRVKVAFRGPAGWLGALKSRVPWAWKRRAKQWMARLDPRAPRYDPDLFVPLPSPESRRS